MHISELDFHSLTPSPLPKLTSGGGGWAHPQAPHSIVTWERGATGGAWCVYGDRA